MFAGVSVPVGIGMQIPTHTLDVGGDAHISGNLTWEPETSYLSIPTAALLCEEPTVNMWDMDPYHYQGVGVNDWSCAPVYLPHASTVTRLTFYWNDEHSPYNTKVTLYRWKQGLSHPDALGYCESTGSSGEGVTVDSTIDYAVINNSEYVYGLWVCTGSGPAFAYQYVIIEYITTKPH
jgi:hypothetical protein